MFWERKKIIVPTGDTKMVEVLKSWKVTWKSYQNQGNGYISEYGHLTENCVFLLSKEEANDFVSQLHAASKLLKSYVSTAIEEN